MIDLGISKLMIIGVVALVVIGPEKLPRVARTAGTLLGRAQRYINEVKTEVSQQMELDELNKMKKSVEDAAREMQESVNKTKQDVYKAQRDIEAQIQEANPKDAITQGDPLDNTTGVAATPGQAIEPLNTVVPESSVRPASGSLSTLPPPNKPASELQRLGQESLRDMVRKVTGKLPEEKRGFQQKCRSQRQATPIWYKRKTLTKNSLRSNAARRPKP